MAAVGAGVLLLCLSSSAARYLFTQGDDDKKPQAGPGPTSSTPTGSTGSTGPTGPTGSTGSTGPSDLATGPTGPTTPEGYTKIDNFNFSEVVENCSSVNNINACSTKCNYDPDCAAFTYDKDKVCCIKYGVNDIEYNENVNSYFKTPNQYRVVKLGDRTGGLIESLDDKNIEECSVSCNNTNNCVGFSYEKGTCELKKSDGLTENYYQNGKQFFENTKPKSSPTTPTSPASPASSSSPADISDDIEGVFSIQSKREGGRVCSDTTNGVKCYKDLAVNTNERFKLKPASGDPGPGGIRVVSIESEREGGRVCSDTTDGLKCYVGLAVNANERFKLKPASTDPGPGNHPRVYSIESEREGGRVCSDTTDGLKCYKDLAVNTNERFSFVKL
jgi:hypothetical protein